MSNTAKVLRGQLRQITQELLPSMVTDAVKSSMFEALQTEIRARLTKIENNVKETLEALDTRQKDTLGYLVRSINTPTIETASPNLDAPAVVAGEPKSE